MMFVTAGPQSLSVAVPSPNSVFLTLVAPYDTAIPYILQGDMWDLY